MSSIEAATPALTTPSSPAAVGATDRAEARRLLWIAVEVAGLYVLMRLLRIENAAFYDRVAPLAVGGAVVNHFLPARLRLGFFSLLSVAAIWLVFGWLQGTWLVGVGMVLIALCHVPARFGVRVALLLTAGGVLAAMRAGVLPTPFAGTIWAILGSMFMFRLIVYMYDVRHMKQETTWAQRLAYFFCLPNVAFPLFPVIDFATFRRTYYDRSPSAIYQEGVSWIVRGMLHLVAYRIVYRFLTLSPADVRTGADLAQYAVANFGLYLRVSGQFHLIVGLLHLFGFRLPETHKFFYLASSFSDLWRRINIYWKDFMQKVFYLPLFFRLMRTRGETAAMVLSTAFVFFATWFFHSYQWFWILGTWLWSATDTLFWAILGGCLIVNALREARLGRIRAVGTPTLSAARLARHGVQTAVMFTVMCALWALWTSPSLDSFVALVRGVTVSSRDVALVVAGWMTIALVAILAYRRAHRASGGPAGGQWATAAAAACLVGVAAGGTPQLGGVVSPEVRAVLSQAREPRLNKRDQEQLQRGYYEKLVGVDRFNGELWNVYAGRPARMTTLREAGALRFTDDARLEELVPGVAIDFHGTKLTVNADGLRDRTYARQKSPGTLRLAVLGQSYVMGSGVNDHEVFDNHLEQQLTREWAAQHGYSRVEVLNFGVPSFSAFQQRALLKLGKVRDFAPDVVILIGHQSEFRLITDYILPLLRRTGVDSMPPDLVRVVQATGLTARTPRDDAMRRLAGAAPQLILAGFQDIVRSVRADGATPLFAYVPIPRDPEEGDRDEAVIRFAREAGFEGVIDLRSLYRRRDEKKLSVSEWDRHPNAEGHRLMAAALHDALVPYLPPMTARASTPSSPAGAERRTSANLGGGGRDARR